ncbi:MAG: histidine--tRNA ligase [Nanoarchaeota archaeon]
MKLQTPRGTEDVLPADKKLQQEVIEVLQKAFERYGFQPLETPTIELFDVLSVKYAGGEEILKETFSLQDQGKRKLALRYDLTVPLARFIAMNPQLKLPFKRYQIGKVFRDGPIKKGRKREFTQCDADIVGTSSIRADAECINLLQEGFSKLKIPVVIEVNSRKIIDELLTSFNVPKEKQLRVILVIDKLKKIGRENVQKELEGLIDSKTTKKLLELIGTKGTNTEKIKVLQEFVSKDSLDEIKKLFAKGISFEPSLSRGLAYYTGMVVEVFTKKDRTVSLGGGGRYDKMIGGYCGREVPAVGVSFGLVPITLALKKKENESITKVYVIPIKTEKESFKIVQELRDYGVNTDWDLTGRGVSKNLDYASKLWIPYVLIVGEKEVSQKKYTLRNMLTGKEERLSLLEVKKKLM